MPRFSRKTISSGSKPRTARLRTTFSHAPSRNASGGSANVASSRASSKNGATTFSPCAAPSATHRGAMFCAPLSKTFATRNRWSSGTRRAGRPIPARSSFRERLCGDRATARRASRGSGGRCRGRPREGRSRRTPAPRQAACSPSRRRAGRRPSPFQTSETSFFAAWPRRYSGTQTASPYGCGRARAVASHAFATSEEPHGTFRSGIFRCAATASAHSVSPKASGPKSSVNVITFAPASTKSAATTDESNPPERNTPTGRDMSERRDWTAARRASRITPLGHLPALHLPAL